MVLRSTFSFSFLFDVRPKILHCMLVNQHQVLYVKNSTCIKDILEAQAREKREDPVHSFAHVGLRTNNKQLCTSIS